ncbi:putative fused nickel transport protein LarMN [Streptococcus thermophilus]|nr:putative fused nickel transport protein LarMN [Streptococcus thermophilus]
MLGIGTSLSFLIMMFNLPAPGGTSAHAVGAVLIAILLGPWASCLAVSVALAMQALLFGDGGILAFGANAFCMAVVMPFVGYAVYKLLNKWTKNRIIASFFGGYIGIVVAALTVAVLLGIQPILFKDSSGNPLYNPYPLRVTLPVMGLTHLLIGLVEGFFTAGVQEFIERLNIDNTQEITTKKLRPLLLFILALIILTPLGLLATGTAFAEWDVKELVEKLSHYHVEAQAPKGMLNGFSFNALFPDYSIAGIPEILGYILSAASAVLIFFILYRLIFGRKIEK